MRTAEDRDKLYPVDVLESRGDSVKTHYVEYDDKFDEWRKKEDIVRRSNDQSHNTRGSALQLELYLRREVAYAIKAALNSSQRSNSRLTW